MTNSLIERLRRYQHDITRGLEPKAEYVYELTGKAADEIERLRAALEEIVNHPEATNYESPSYYHGRDELQEIAREALKDDTTDR